MLCFDIEIQRQIISAAQDDFSPNSAFPNTHGGQFGNTHQEWRKIVVEFIYRMLASELIAPLPGREGYQTKSAKEIQELLKCGDTENWLGKELLWDIIYFTGTPKLRGMLDGLNLNGWEARNENLSLALGNELARMDVVLGDFSKPNLEKNVKGLDAPPSEASALLRRLIGQKVVSIHRLVRYSFEKLAGDFGITDSTNYFRLAPGDVFVQFESGDRIRIGSDLKHQTLLISLTDGNLDEEAKTLDYLHRKGTILSAADETCTDDQIRRLIGATIENIGIIAINNNDSRSINQRGIVLYINESQNIILGIQMRHKVTGSLSFMRFDDIDPNLRPYLTQVGANGGSLPLLIG